MVEETRKAIGENVRLPEEEEKKKSQEFSLSEYNMIKQLTLATIEQLNGQLKVSDSERADRQ